MNIIDKIKNNLINSEREGNKTAEFHYQILINADELKDINADELKDIDAEEFCQKLSLTDGYKSEFRKMIKLANHIKSKGKKII